MHLFFNFKITVNEFMMRFRNEFFKELCGHQAFDKINKKELLINNTIILNISSPFFIILL